MATLPVVRDSDLETVTLVWLDGSANTAEENIATQKQIRSVIHQFKTFSDVQDCHQYIQHKSKDDRIFLIVSGQLGQRLVPSIHRFRQVCAIYVYCKDKQRNEEWARQFPKIKGVIIQLDLLINRIQADYTRRIQSKVDEPFPINIYKLNNSLEQSINNECVHFQILIDCLLQMKTLSTDKNEILNLCKSEYSNNKSETSIIQEFEKNYSSNQVLGWYTRECFLSRLLKKALSVKNIDLLFLFAFFIRDIKENVEKTKYKSPIQVYHGQIMSTDELQTLKNCVGEYISINTFLVTNFNRPQIISNLNAFPITEDLVRIVFEIDAVPHIENSRPFAYVPNEQQVLFMLGSIFQVTDIQYDKKNGLWIIKIVLSSIKKEYDERQLISCGQILYQMGKFDEAEKYFSRLLKESPSDQEDIIQCNYTLGLISFAKDNYNLSLQYYQKTLKLMTSNDPCLADSSYSIGCVYQKLNNYEQALEYYTKALNIWKEIYGDDGYIQMAECLNNIGCIYEAQNSYSKSLEYHNKALVIRNRFRSDIGSSYNNIANIYLTLGEYNTALENYNYSLEIKSNSLPSEHPSFAMTLANIALVYERDENFQEALKYYKKAAFIFQQKFSLKHIWNIQIQEDIKRTSSLLRDNIINPEQETLV